MVSLNLTQVVQSILDIEINTWVDRDNPVILEAVKYIVREGEFRDSVPVSEYEVLDILKKTLEVAPRVERVPKSGARPRTWRIKVAYNEIVIESGGGKWGFVYDLKLNKVTSIRRYFSYSLFRQVVADAISALLFAMNKIPTRPPLTAIAVHPCAVKLGLDTEDKELTIYARFRKR